MIKPQKSYLFSDTLQDYDKQIRSARSNTPRRDVVPTPVRSTKNINKKFFETSSRMIQQNAIDKQMHMDMINNKKNQRQEGQKLVSVLKAQLLKV